MILGMWDKIKSRNQMIVLLQQFQKNKRNIVTCSYPVKYEES